MNASREKLKKLLDLFQEKLKRSGIKLTHQRLEIYKELASSFDHPDAIAIFKGVRKRVPTISLDTVYRTLWLFLDLGIITTLGTNHKQTRFDANMKAHHHFICSNCGKTMDFYNKEFDKLNLPHNTKVIGDIQTTQVIVKGVCNQCLEKLKNKQEDSL